MGREPPHSGTASYGIPESFRSWQDPEYLSTYCMSLGMPVEFPVAGSLTDLS